MRQIGLVIVTVFVLLAVLAEVIVPFGFQTVRDGSGLFGILAAPNEVNILGTTSLGMDVFSRLILGTQTALLTVSLCVFASLFWALSLTVLSGKSGSKLEAFALFVTDVLISIPSLLIGIVVALAVSSGKSSVETAIIATVVSEVFLFGSKYFRVLRVSLSEIRQTRFVEAARVLGLSKLRIFFVHELPNSLGSIPVLMAQNAASSVFTLAGLGFLGVGIQANTGAEWGFDLNKGLSDLQVGIWWTTAFPAGALALLIIGFGLLAETLSTEKDG